MQKRPLSPHLSIYKYQVNSVLSIFHRISGVGLFFVLSTLSWWSILFIFSGFKPCYTDLFHNIFVRIFLTIGSYGFFYHFSTGIRHLVWDTGIGFSVSAINSSSWFVLLFSIMLTLIFGLIII